MMPDTLSRSELRPRRVQLSEYTTLGVGGPAELWVCHSLSELIEATEAPYRLLGGGSNLLVADEGVHERVIRLAGEFAKSDLELEPLVLDGSDASVITGWIGAAKPMPGLLRALQRRGLSGLEGLWGVPAVVGGAVRMNAGTRFGEMSAALEEVELFLDGKVERVRASELGFGYRSSNLPQGAHGSAVVLRVRLRLQRAKPELVQGRMDLADVARKGQPHQRTFGCAFKNPAGASAGQLIDRAGLKGQRVGRAMVSLEHGNFIVNTGAATARDVLALLAYIESTLGVPLEREVEVWGTD